MSINKVILLGNVGGDPDVKYLDSGNSVAKFSLATSESYKNKAGEKVENTEWHNIVIWGPLAGVVEKYVIKGMKLYIEGRIKYRSYTDKNGDQKYFTEIIADKLEMLGKKSEQSQPESQKTESSITKEDFESDKSEFDTMDLEPQDDLPF